MRKITPILLIGISTLFFTACGGGSDNSGGNTPAPPTSVNLVGTWDDTFATSGSTCDGLIANYIAVNEPYNGDPNVLGVSTIDGTIFDIDSGGNCYLAPIHKVDASAAGTPSNMTEDQYIEFQRQRMAGIGTIDSFHIINYNTNIISIQVNYTNGMVLYADAVRQ